MERLSVQLPIEVAPDDRQRSEPEPGIAVLNALLPDYSQRHPRGERTHPRRRNCRYQFPV
jgi:hypothetical protein